MQATQNCSVVTEISKRVSGLYNHPEGVAAAFIEQTRVEVGA